MADVDDRGQLLLVGALTLAVMLVALAVLLNAAIYTGNVATRDAGPGTTAAIEYENEATSVARSTIDALNDRENDSYQHLRENFTATVGVWSETARVHATMSLADATVETVDAPTRGTAIHQETSRNFTSATSDANWTVANDSRVRAFRLNVSQDSLATPDEDAVDLIFGGEEPPDYFRIRFTDGTEEWRVYFAGDANGSVDDDVTVRVRHDGSTVGEACSVAADSDRAVVDLTDARVGGEHCEALATMFSNIDAPYTIEYRNGQNAEGTHSLVVDRPLDRLDTGADTTGDDEPSATRALYSAELELTYRTADIYYQTELEIAPGEVDD